MSIENTEHSAKRQILSNLIADWIESKVNKSNQNISAAAKIKLREKNPFQFDLIIKHQSSKVEFENSSLINDHTLLLQTVKAEKKGNAKPREKIRLKADRLKYNNPSDKGVEIDILQDSQIKQIYIQEREKSKTHGVNTAIGASAFGANLNLGYNFKLSVRKNERLEEHGQNEDQIKIPIIIPPGKIDYEINIFRSELMQPYELDLLLRGQIKVNFKKNYYRIAYENGLFTLKEEHTFSRKSSCIIAITDIFEDLRLAGKFPNASLWKLDKNKQLVSYRDNVEVFEIYSTEIEVKAITNELNISSTNTTQPPSKKDAKVNMTTEPNAELVARHSTFRTKKERVAVQMSPKSAESEKLAPVIKEKIILGLNAEPNYKMLFEALVKPEYEKQTDFIKDEMKAIREGTPNPDAKAYLAWLEKNYEKVGNIDNIKEFTDRSIDLYISDEKLDIDRETGALPKKKQ